jgi:hypothetical protein
MEYELNFPVIRSSNARKNAAQKRIRVRGKF